MTHIDINSEGCRVPTYGPTGFGSATMIAGPHDWRLLEEKPVWEPATTPDWTAPVDRPELTPYRQSGTTRRWYCTRCRTINTTTETNP